MIIFIAAAFFLVSVAHEGNCGELCQTPACVSTATRVTESMNNTGSPCDNFYEFACGGWIMKNPIPPKLHTMTTLHLIAKEIDMQLQEILNTPDSDGDGKPIKLARALYKTCMDEGSIKKLGLKPLHDTLTKLGLPHMPPSDEEAKNLDIPKIVGLASRFYNLGIFFGINIGTGLSNETKNHLAILQRSPGFNNFDIYVQNPALFKQAVPLFTGIIKGGLTIGGAGEKSEDYAKDVLGFMIKIAKIMTPLAERASRNYSPTVDTIDKIQEMTDPHGDTWNWTTYFKAVFEQTDIIIDPKTDTVIIYDDSYSKKLISLLKETPRRTIALYAWWLVMLLYLEKSFSPFSKLPRENICLGVVNKYFEPALTAAYVGKHFNVEYKKNVMQMWADVNSTLDEMIDELDWMDAETKAHAHAKLHATKLAVGYPEWITNPEELNKYYESFEVFEGRLFDTYTHYQLIQGKRERNSWKQIPDRYKWKDAGTSPSATYVALQNTIEINAGILHSPVYGNAVESLNYGAIGSMMGSQLIQSIDYNGGERDENRNKRRWWSEKTSQAYGKNVGCIMKQYTDLVITRQGHDFTLNGRNIQRGSMMYIAAVKIAFRAYKKFKARSAPQQVLPALDKYTDEQLFYLGFAQTLCERETAVGMKENIETSQLPSYRYLVIGTLQNSEEFAKAWNCSPDSPMNPKKKCTTVW